MFTQKMRFNRLILPVSMLLLYLQYPQPVSDCSLPPPAPQIKKVMPQIKRDNYLRLINYDSYISLAVKNKSVDKYLIGAVIMAESGGKPHLVSRKGAIGLMQLMPDTANDLGIKDPFDIKQNILGGTTYLDRLYKKYDGNLELTLAAYNWGPTNLDRLIEKAGEDYKNRLPRETIRYISRVKENMKV